MQAVPTQHLKTSLHVVHLALFLSSKVCDYLNSSFSSILVEVSFGGKNIYLYLFWGCGWEEDPGR